MPTHTGTASHAATSAALAVATDPARFADRPQMRLLAWATLKSARGQTVRQHRLQTAARTANRKVA